MTTNTVDTTTSAVHPTENPEIANAQSYEICFLESIRSFVIGKLAESIELDFDNEDDYETAVSEIEKEINDMNIYDVYTHEQFDLIEFTNDTFLDWSYKRETGQYGWVYQFCTGTGGPEQSFWLTESGWRTVHRNWFTHGDIETCTEIAGFMDYCLNTFADLEQRTKADMLAILAKVNYQPKIEEDTFTMLFSEWAEWRNDKNEIAMQHSDLQRRMDNGEMWHCEIEITDVELDRQCVTQAITDANRFLIGDSATVGLLDQANEIDNDVTDCDDADEIIDPLKEQLATAVEEIQDQITTAIEKLTVTVSYTAKLWVDHPPADWEE